MVLEKLDNNWECEFASRNSFIFVSPDFPFSLFNMYMDFRNEIESMYAPHIFKDCTEIISIKENNQEIGLLLLKDKYIQSFYIKPEYRRKGYGRKAILNYIKEYGMPKDLTILNTNYVALDFWYSIFVLKPINVNSIDTYYEIISLKEDINNAK
jgi:GNAT superfamily N-acetyltransferase